jgi:hypothetical protein
LREAHAGRAEARTALGKPADADWGAALRLASAADRVEVRLRRARALASAGDHRRAAAEARDLAAEAEAPADTLDVAARVLARCASKADAATADGYAAEAVALLRRAHAAGKYHEADASDKLHQDAELKPLHERADFRRFASEVGP